MPASGTSTAPEAPPGVTPSGEGWIPLGVLALFGFWSLRERQFLLVDDAYIAFRYAVNFASGQGLVWNPGEHVEGYTNLLWVLLFSGFAKLGVDLTWPSVCGSFAFAAGTLVITWRLSRQVGLSRRAALIPPLLLAANFSFAHAATSGMESTAFGFFVLLAVDCLVRSREAPRLRGASAICFFLACLLRPEGALVAAVVLAVELATTPGSFSARIRRLAPIGVAMAFVVIAHTAARLAYYGYPFPNTFYAKVIFGAPTIARGVAHVTGFMVAGGAVALPGMLEVRRQGPGRPLLVHGYCLFWLYLLYLVVIGGDHPHWYRFYVPLMPLPFVATGKWAGRIATAVRAKRLGGEASRAVAPAVSIALLVSASELSAAFAERREVVGQMSARDADVMRKVTAFFIDEVPERSFVAAGAVGYLGYYARSLHVLDMWGLNDAHIAHRSVAASTKFGHDKGDLAYVAAQKPDYVYAFVLVRPVPAAPGYDLCWPSSYFPVAVYRRNFALGAEEAGLGVAPPATRLVGTPPPCRPPGSAPAPTGDPIPAPL